MRSHGPSCKRWRCSMQLLFHFPCWTWSITLNGNLAQSSLTSWSPPSLLSFVATFLFTDFPLCPDWELRQTIDPMQGARNLLSNKSSFAHNAFQLRELCPFFPSLQSAPWWFQHVHLRCLRHSSSNGSSIVSIMDALNRGLDGDPEYSTFLHCKSLDLCTKLMRLSDVRSWNLKMLMMVFKILGTVSLLIIWVSCPAWLVKFGASPDMCSFRVMSLTKRKARSRFAIICKHMQHNHILN